MGYYLSLQYSAIQKVILRHDRLWSISGMSHILSEINEVKMRKIAETHNGLVILAGGGKFTARFEKSDDAKKARSEIENLISTTLPMLEYQISSIVQANSFREAKEKKELEGRLYPGITNELSEMKRVFRGYGLTYNPHFMVCEECEEYPAEQGLYAPKNKHLCRICHNAREMARIDLSALTRKEDSTLTSINKVYKRYMERINSERPAEIPLDMEDLFRDNNEDSAMRIAVWMSDINNMGDMIPLWNMQEEDKILATFDGLKELMIDTISEALAGVFPESEWIEKEKEGERKLYIPFRLVVAGGDDLCIIMPYRYILSFAERFSSEIESKTRNAGSYNEALTKEWLETKYKELFGNEPRVKDISFGSSFVVTPIHTPFTKIHEVGERLMSEAKKRTERKGNSINWRILAADEEPLSERILKSERPLLMGESIHDYLSFKNYLDLCEDYKKISGSQLHQIIGKIIEFKNDGEMLERCLLRMPEAGKEDSVISKILRDKRFRDPNDRLKTERIVTLFELLTLFE